MSGGGGKTLLALLCGLPLIGLLIVSTYGTHDEGRAPVQPINFFHRVHSGERKIACAYCHRTVEKADYAGMPDVRLCMGCHRVILPQYHEIWKLRSYWELQEPIPWQRVNRLPGHVYFSHEAHTRGAGLSCAPCHGQVESMYRVHQTAPLTMKWCLTCHRQRSASTECITCQR